MAYTSTWIGCTSLSLCATFSLGPFLTASPPPNFACFSFFKHVMLIHVSESLFLPFPVPSFWQALTEPPRADSENHVLLTHLSHSPQIVPLSPCAQILHRLLHSIHRSLLQSFVAMSVSYIRE